MKTILLAGLGNPGKKYEKTRHNAGFLFVDFIFQKFREEFGFSDWEFKKSLNAEISIGKIDIPAGQKENKHLNFLAYAKKLRCEKIHSGGAKFILLKPQAFMNLSGEAMKKAVKYYKVNLKNLLVAHDDIDFALGKYKISTGSRAAGHNGVQNIIDQLGTKDFARIRIGVDDRKNKKTPTEKYVLGKFTSAELKTISKTNSEASKDFLKKYASELFSDS